METVEWVFRHAGNCLIEVPPLELPPPPDRATMTAWVATLWPDATSHNGWTALPWVKADRGWEIPRHLAVGDVLEFGLAAVSVTDGTVLPGWEQRWYGWLIYSSPLALVVQGGYPHAPAAADGAAATVAAVRLAQLPSPEVDPSWVADELGDDIGTEP